LLNQVNGHTTAQPTVASPLAASKQQAATAPPSQNPPAVKSSPSPFAPAAAAAAAAAAGGGLFGSNAQSNGIKPAAPAAPAAPPPNPEAQNTIDRYTVIHKNLKQLRKSMAEQAKTNRALKDRMGDMRRDIRKCVGQLTGGVGANRQQVK
jgi:nucleoporin GLE1